jgi:hypothetical protein
MRSMLIKTPGLLKHMIMTRSLPLQYDKRHSNTTCAITDFKVRRRTLNTDDFISIEEGLGTCISATNIPSRTFPSS